MEFKHFSVLFSETMEHLNIRENGLYADGTLGGGGHSEGILLRSNTSKLIGIDRDTEALKAAGERLSVFGDRVSFEHANYSEIKRIVGDKLLDGAVLDLGVSSYQLDNKDRGFSYMHDAPLDMRMDQGATLSAYEVVNTYSEEELTRIFYEYGEEKWSKRIAKFIVDARPVKTTGELSDIIKAAIPKAAREQGGHPAKRVFQAIRIEVNSELSLLKQSLLDFVDVLAPGGRLAVITFHSLEDRITKLAFSELAKGCICPKEFPVCMCNHKPTVKIITKKPILPSLAELRENSRSKSAKLRVVEKI